MKLKSEEATCENQFSSRPGRGAVDTIFIVNQIIERALGESHHTSIKSTYKAVFEVWWDSPRALSKIMIAIGLDPEIVVII